MRRRLRSLNAHLNNLDVAGFLCLSAISFCYNASSAGLMFLVIGVLVHVHDELKTQS